MLHHQLSTDTFGALAPPLFVVYAVSALLYTLALHASGWQTMLYDPAEGTANTVTSILLVAIGALLALYHLAMALAQPRP
jgi:hypothetical protein